MMENMEQAKAKMEELEGRLREKGVVDVKFCKAPSYYDLSPLDRARQLCEVLEASLDGPHTPFAGCGDSVRSLLGEDNTSPITLSPTTRCGGESDTGDYNEEQQKGGTAAP